MVVNLTTTEIDFIVGGDSKIVDMENCTCSYNSCDCSDLYLDRVQSALSGASALISIGVFRFNQQQQTVTTSRIILLGLVGGIIGWAAASVT